MKIWNEKWYTENVSAHTGGHTLQILLLYQVNIKSVIVIEHDVNDYSLIVSCVDWCVIIDDLVWLLDLPMTYVW